MGRGSCLEASGEKTKTRSSRLNMGAFQPIGKDSLSGGRLPSARTQSINIFYFTERHLRKMVLNIPEKVD